MIVIPNVGPSSTPQVALVTGGSRGIGAVVVETLAREGWTVAFTYRSGRTAAAELTDRLTREGLRAGAYQADVKDFEQAAQTVARVAKDWGPVDALVNNAGIKRDMALFRMTPEDWSDVIETNLGGVFNYCRAVIGGMIRRETGAIVNVVSVSALKGTPGQANYSASKAGIIGLTRSLAQEVARFSIRVNAVAPGFIETDMLADMPDRARERLFANVPLGAPGSPAQVAQAVAFLLGDRADYITGQVLPVDGGIV